MAGVADLIISTPPPKYPEARGIAIEMKSPKGRVTDDQTFWLNMVHNHGWMTCVAYSAEEAIEFLISLGF